MIEQLSLNGGKIYYPEYVELLFLKDLSESVQRKEYDDNTLFLYKCLNPIIMDFTIIIFSIEYSNAGYIIVPDEYEYYVRYLLSGKSHYYTIFYNTMLIYKKQNIKNKYFEKIYNLFEKYLPIFENFRSYYISEPQGFKRVNPHHQISKEECKTRYYRFGDGIMLY